MFSMDMGSLSFTDYRPQWNDSLVSRGGALAWPLLHVSYPPSSSVAVTAVVCNEEKKLRGRAGPLLLRQKARKLTGSKGKGSV